MSHALVISINYLAQILTGYYQMEQLPVFLSDHAEPTFLVEEVDGRILQANQTAKAGCGELNPIGEPIENVVFIDEKSTDAVHSYFNKQWFELKREAFDWKGERISKVTLKRPKSAPDAETLQIVRNMIAVWLHQMRSPLTGMQGYLEMVQDDLSTEEHDAVDKRFNAMNNSIDKLFDLMDELEMLHDAAADPQTDDSYHLADPDVFINDLLAHYSPETRQQFTILTPDEPTFFNCNPLSLKRILSLLIQNAVEHHNDQDQKILVEIISDRTIKISNSGAPIPEHIADQLFQPFVTTKADKLGIGLTMAMLYANHLGGSIFLTENSQQRGISFTVCLPPVQQYHASVSLAEIAS